MKKNKVFFLGLITVFVAILSLTLVSGTWAKYTSNVTSAEATARAAKWAWKVQDADAATDFTFDLFKTITDTKNNAAQGVTTPDYTESDVKVAGTTETPIIAPGTKGEAKIKVENASEVSGTIKAVFVITENNDGIPLTLTASAKKGSGNSTTDLAADAYTIEDTTVDGKTAVEVTIKRAAISDVHEITLTWTWAFEGDGTDSNNDGITDVDAADTILGKAGTATVKVKATVVFTQVD